jgi:hypothetical protein
MMASPSPTTVRIKYAPSGACGEGGAVPGGLVARQDHGTVPPRVDYRLTGDGQSLAPVLQALYDWGAARAARTGTPIDEPA